MRSLRFDYHQVGIQGQVGVGLKALNDHGAEGDVGDEPAIHDVQMDIVGACFGSFGDLLAQPGEVGGEDGRGQFYLRARIHGQSPAVFWRLGGRR